MKRTVLVSLAVLLFLSISSAVFAVGPDPLEADVDCTGWSMGGIMHFGSWDHIDYYYRVSLIKDGDTIQTYTGTGTVYDTGDPEFVIEGEWDMELCGDYTAYIYSQWIGQYGPGVLRFELPFTCECGPVCNYPAIYWLKNEAMWPADELTIGCRSYSKDELLKILGMRPFISLTVAVSRQLIAAKLNVVNGADDYIQPWIDAGDKFLCKYPIGSRVCFTDWRLGFTILANLFAYNWRPCDAAYSTAPLFSIESIEDMPEDAEEKSWGSIKQMHR